MKLHRLFEVLLIGLMLPTGVGAALGPEDQRQLADGLFARGMYAMALREYLVLINSLSNSPQADDALFRIAESYRNLTNRVDAIRYYQAVESRFPQSTFRFRAGLRRVEFLQESGQTNAVLKLLNELLSAKPPDDLAASAWYTLGSTLLQQGRTVEATAALERVAGDYSASPHRPYAMLTLATLKAAEPAGRARAMELFQVVATNPATPRMGAEAWFQLADVQFREKAYAKSVEAYTQLCRLYPADPRATEAQLPRAWAEFYAGMPADAVRHADEALAAAATNLGGVREEWLYLKANGQRQLLKYADAARTYAALLAEYPLGRLASAAGYENALSLFKAGSFREAVTQAKAIEKDPDRRKDLLWILAESHSALKEEDQAIQYYRALIAQYPDSPMAPDAGYRVARLLQKKEQYLAAAELFGTLARQGSDPEIAEQALFASAMCFSRAGKQEEAIRDYAAFIQKYPQRFLVEEALYQKAMSETFLHRDTQAMATLRDLLERKPGTRFVAEARFWLGVLLDGSGKLEDAEGELRKAQTAKPAPELARRIQFQLALVLHKRGQYDEASVLFHELLATPIRERMTPALLEWLAEYELAHQAHERALQITALLIERGTTSNSWAQLGWCLKGRGLQALGKKAEAKEAFEKALEANAGIEIRAEATLRLGELLLQTGELTGAKERFDQAAAMAGDDALLSVRVQAYAGIGKALKAQGNAEGAVKYFMSVAVLFDDPVLVPECLAEAALLFEQLGQKEDADKAWKELADRYPRSSLIKKPVR